ncbi:hypothetical protein [Erythrobacter litoralis]|nr:hypothetical protein [Erythrobacter litoralis]
MPIWFEVVAMMLVAYAVGLLIGWSIWGRAPSTEISEEDEQ